MLALREVTDRGDEERDVPLLLTLHLRRRVLARRRQMRAVVWTVDLDETLRGAADRADGLAECRTAAATLALATDGTSHAPAWHSHRTGATHGEVVIPPR